MKSWDLREEIHAITHRWYFILFYVLLGVLSGWAVSIFWPSTFRATRNLYVGLNAYRSPYDSYAESLAGQSFRLVDDYKNWQMEQLNALIRADVVINDTLDELNSQATFWKSISTEEFRQMTAVFWRNPGKWSLVVEASDPGAATQAVLVWEQVVYRWVADALEHARQVVNLDIQMTQLAETRIQHKLRLNRLQFAAGQLTTWREVLETMPSDQAVPSLHHWNIWGSVSQAADSDPGWILILDEAPRVGSTPTSYVTWLEAVIALIKQELAYLPEQIAVMDEQFSALNQQYREEAPLSFGLASTLVLERNQDTSVSLEEVRPSGTLLLVGGILGFLTWALSAFKAISRRQ